MRVIGHSFSGAQVRPSSRMAFATQRLGHAGFESRVQQPATGFSKSGSREVNLTASLIGGGKAPRGQVLIFNVAKQFRRWGGRPQEQRSDAGGGFSYPLRAIRRCVNDTEEFGSRPESGLLQAYVTNRPDTANTCYLLNNFITSCNQGVNVKDLTRHSCLTPHSCCGGASCSFSVAVHSVAIHSCEMILQAISLKS